MTSNLDSVLEDCLERIAQGETLQRCLELYPEHAAELKPMLLAAARLESSTQVRPSGAFKTRARAQLYAHMEAHPRQRGWSQQLSPVLRTISVLATLLLAFTVTGTALAQSALPGQVLYPWKLASERVWHNISSDPVGVDLVLADRRVDEAVAVSQNSEARDIALHGYEKVMKDLASESTATADDRVQAGLKDQQDRLKNAGLEVPKLQDGEVVPASHTP